jgi:hypothetical protein
MVMLIGGKAGPNTMLSSCTLLDPVSQRQEVTRQLPHDRSDHAAAAVGEAVAVAGGYRRKSGRRLPLSSSLLFRDGRWIEMGEMGEGITMFSLVSDGATIYAVGDAHFLEVCDPSVGKWKVVGPEHKTSHSISSIYHDGRIYVSGGYYSPKTLNIYEVRSGKWSSGPQMTTGREDHGLVELDGKLYAVGGVSDEADQSVEVLDLRAGRWELLEARLQHPCLYAGVSTL